MEKPYNVNADKGNEDALPSEVVDGDCNTNNRHNEFAYTHADSADKKQTTATETFHTPDARNSHANIDNVGGDENQEWIFYARVVEEGCSVIEDEVDARELLPSGRCSITNGGGRRDNDVRLDEDTSERS
jgi:hypothetical protein